MIIERKDLIKLDQKIEKKDVYLELFGSKL